MHKVVRSMAATGLATALALIAGCATVASTKDPTDAKHARGMLYRMPLQWIRVSLTVAQGKRSITVEPTPAFADTSAIYVARFTRSVIANDDFKVNVDENGLLNNDQTFTTESKLVDGLSDLAKAIGMTYARTAGDNADRGDGSKTPCDGDGLYVWDLDPTAMNDDAYQEPLVCHINVQSRRIGPSPLLPSAKNYTWPDLEKSGSSANGLYYRQALPFDVRVFDDTSSPLLTITKIMALPTKDSPVGFIPIARTLFAKNDTKITFKSGMPTAISIDQDSEWLALSSAPAAVIKAYIDAVKDGITSRKETLDEQVKYLDSLSKAKAQEARTAACLLELAKPTPDADQVKTLCGGE